MSLVWFSLLKLKNEHLLLKSGFNSCHLFSVCFFPNRLTFVHDVLMDVRFEIRIRNFQVGDR